MTPPLRESTVVSLVDEFLEEGTASRLIGIPYEATDRLLEIALQVKSYLLDVGARAYILLRYHSEETFPAVPVKDVSGPQLQRLMELSRDNPKGAMAFEVKLTKQPGVES